MNGFKRATAAFCLLLTLVWQVQSATAAVIGTTEALEHGVASSAAVRDQLRSALAREESRAWLSSQGIAPEQVEARIAQLTDAEAQILADKLEQLPAGGDIVGLLLFLFVVFVVTDALGATDIFPFVHPIKK